MRTLLLIEDDSDIREVISSLLEPDYNIISCAEGIPGLQLALTHSIDLIILDLGLPDLSGIEIAKKIRKKGLAIPILLLTADDRTRQKVAALDAGADDYLTKPFSIEELEARIRALLRRQVLKRDNLLSYADLCLDKNTSMVRRANQEVRLPKKQFQMLSYFLEHPGQILTRTMLYDHLWSEQEDRFSNVVEVQIKLLREKIDKPFSRKLLNTVAGVGYRLE